MTAPTPPTSAARRRHVERFLALQPALRRGFAPLPDELRDRLRSITLHQLEALHAIGDTGVSMSELAHALGISDASATALVDRLVRNQLAVREADPTDRRVVRIVRSPGARDLLERVHQARCSALTRLFSALDDQQVAAFMDALETLARTTGSHTEAA